MAAKKSASKKSSSKKSSSSKKKSASRSASSRTPDAIALLRADHKLVKELFDKFEKARGDDRKEAIAEQICKELTVHAKIEEEIFYPAARGALRQEDLVDEATVEHQSAKDLIAQIEGGSPDDELWEAKVKVLGEYIDHHVKEEQNEMFAQIKRTKLDLAELGEQLQARKMELKESEGGSSGRGRRGGGSSGASRGKSGGGKSGGQTEEEGLVARMARGIGLSGS